MSLCGRAVLGMARGAQVSQMAMVQNRWLRETRPGTRFPAHLAWAWHSAGVSRCLGWWEGWVYISSRVGPFLNLGKEVSALMSVKETLICSISFEGCVHFL